jgi:glycosyltransferase involved in cell wall biosynthesis
MKILIASFTFPPNKDGVSEAASVMALGFLAKGWEVEVATSPTAPARGNKVWRGIFIHEFEIKEDWHSKCSHSGDVNKYRNFLKHGGWDVIIFHAYLYSLYASIDILEKIPAKKVLVSHGFAALQWIKAKSFPWGLATWLKSCGRAFNMLTWIHKIDRTVYLSNKADLKGFLDHWIAKSISYKGRRVIPNGVDPELRGKNPNGFREEHGISDKQIVFLCVANYSRRKDQGYAARAFRLAAIPNSVMIFIGSEFNNDSFRFKEEDNRLPFREKSGRIIWLEKIDRARTLDAIAACNVVVISSDHEAQPIALLEAMRESKPWIARDSGCISEMPGGVCVCTEAALAQQMVRLAAYPELQAQLGIQGREAVEKIYNRQLYIDSYCELVSEVTGQ